MRTLPLLSIVIPCFNEEQALPLCVTSLQRYVATKPSGSTEVVLVDDGSTDRTWDVMKRLIAGRPEWRAIRFVANRGSHMALRCACRHATGSRVVNLPVDLQDPIENIDRLERAMDDQGADAVLAVRRTREDGWYVETTSRLYHGAMHLVNLRNVPVEGTSQFLLTRRVVQQINAYDDHGFTFEGFLASAPLKIATVWYDRCATAGRVSRWTLSRKVQHALNTLLGFSNLPIRALSLTGAFVTVVGLLYGMFMLLPFARVDGLVAGWPSLMTAILVLGGLSLLAHGLVGEYLWRVLDESRRRPLYQIEDRIGFEDDELVGLAAVIADGNRSFKQH